MEPQNVSEKIKTYYAHRTHANRVGLWVVLVSTALFAVARSPNFAIKDLFGAIEGTFHAGYVAAYGHFIVLGFMASYWSSFLACSRLNSAVRRDLRGVKTPGKHTETEEFLLRPPLCSLPDWHRHARSWFCAVFPIVFGTVIYAMFLWDYYGFHAPGKPDERFGDLLFGNGFLAVWKRGIPSLVWINAPEQTFFGNIGLALCVYLIVSTAKALKGFAQTPVTLPWARVIKWLHGRRRLAVAKNLTP